MRRGILLPCLIILLATSCTHKIIRTDYNPLAPSSEECDVLIRKGKPLPAEEAQMLGEIRLADTGVSTSCNEEKAMIILEKEACLLNANLVMITAEEEPNIMSSCYRCEAIFYNTQGSLTMANDSIANYYSDEELEPVKKNNAGAIVGGVLGFVAGFLLVTLLFN